MLTGAQLNVDRVNTNDPIDTVENSREFIAELVRKCLASIEKNVRALPLVFGSLIRSAKRKATDRFPELADSRTVETVFFFLRFIGPCILTPLVYRVPLQSGVSELDGSARKGLVYAAKGMHSRPSRTHGMLSRADMAHSAPGGGQWD